MYRLHVYRRNRRDEYYFHEQKNDRIKTNEDLKKSFNFSTDDSKNSCFKIFLNFTYEKEFTVSFKSFLFH